MPNTERIVVDGLGRLPQFAHAGQAGDALYVSGTLGTVEGLTLADGVGPQTTQTLENIGRILAAARCGWDDVAKVDVYLADIAEFGAMNDAYSAFFGDIVPPARITVGGCDLALGARVEMQCVAHRPQPTRPVSGQPLPSRRRLTVAHDGEDLFVEVVGEEHRGRRAPLVLSHGAGGSHAIWFQQVEHFARDRMVVTWDHRGFGNSTDRADATGPDVAGGDLLAICDHLGIETADLVGQSMGGWTTVAVLLARPTLARRVVLADTLGGITSPAIEAATARPRSGAGGGTAEPPGAVLGIHPAIDPSLAERDPARAHLYQLLGGFGTVDTMTLIGRLLSSSHGEEVAAAITCPVLCVVGDRDPLFAPAAVRALADLLPDGCVSEIPGSGHSPYFEDPELWNAVVRRFLDDSVPARS